MTTLERLRAQRAELAQDLAHSEAISPDPSLRADDARRLLGAARGVSQDLRSQIAEVDAEIARVGSMPLDEYNTGPSTRASENRSLGRFETADDNTPRALRSTERLTDWAIEHRQVPEEHAPNGRPALSLAKYLRGVVGGGFADADLERRAMGESTLSAGGYLVPTVLGSGLIDLARNKARVLQAGATVFPMVNSTVDIPKWAGDPAVAFHTESALISPSDATLSKIRLTAKDATSLVVVSRDLIEDADPNAVEQELRNAFAEQLALTLDSAALYGTGTPPQPQGLKTASGVTSTAMATNGHLFDGTAGFRYEPIVNAVGRVRTANENPNGILYSPRTGTELGLMADSTGQPLAVPPYLDNIPRYETNQIGNTFVVGTSGSNCSDIFVGDWAQLIIGIRTDMKVQVLQERYVEFGQIGFSLWARLDVAVARPAAFQIVTGVL